MRIISNFKDYYDFTGFTAHDDDYRDVVYLRKAELKITDAVLEFPTLHYYSYGQYNDKIISKWWTKSKKAFSLPDRPKSIRAGCLFVCGKAYPFLFLRDTAQIGTEGKGGQIRFSRCFNEVIKNSITKEKRKYHWQRDEQSEEEFNFFRVYYSLEEFFEDVTVEKYMAYSSRWYRTDYLERELKQFFNFYEGKDFTALHLR